MTSKPFVHLFKSPKVQPHEQELWQLETEKLDHLLQYEENNNNDQDSFNECQTAILDATKNGEIETLQANIKGHTLLDIADHNGVTPLIASIIYNKREAFELLISTTVDINQSDTKGNSPLIVAALMGMREFVETLLQRGADFGLSNQYGYSALMAAAGGCHLEIVRFLISQGAVLNLRSQCGMTALMFACSKQSSDVVSYLAKRAKLDIADDDGNTAIAISAKLGDLLSLKALVKENGNVNTLNKRGKTPLMYAVEEGHIEIVKLLVDFKADIDICMEDGKTAIDFAVERDLKEVIQILGGTSSNGLEEPNTMKPIISASLLGDLELVKHEVMKHENVNVTDEFGRTALMAASQEGYSDIVKLLLENKANVNQTNQSGMTALYYAVQRRRKDVQLQLVYYGANTEIVDIYTRTLFMNCVASGNLEIVKDLDKLGCSIFRKDSVGMNALMIAAKGGHMKIVQYLISQGCIKGFQCDLNLTAADYAIFNNHTQVHAWLQACDIEGENEKGQGEKLMEYASNGNESEATKLLKSGCNPDFKDTEGDTPIIVASEKGYTSVVKCLIQHNASVNVRNCNSGKTALIVASRKGYGSVVQVLLDAGAYANIPAKEGTTPLMFASYELYVDIGKNLLVHGARTRTANKNGVTALILASNAGCVEMGKLLLQYGADINACDKVGDSPLHEASRNDHIEMVKFLVEQMADLTITNYNGHTALEGAVRRNNQDIAKYLYECGATGPSVARHVRGDREHSESGNEKRIFNPEDIELAAVYRAEIEHIIGNEIGDSSKEQSLFDICDENDINEEAANNILQQHGTDINLQDGNGDTVLLIAIRKNHPRTCEWIIENGANVNCQDRNGFSPLMYASRSGDFRMVKRLLNSQADVNHKDFKGVSSLMIASSKHIGANSVNTVLLLIKSGARINEVDYNGDTPLIWSVRSGNLDVVKQLLSCGANVNHLNKVCENAVSLAVASNCLDIFHCFLQSYNHIRQDIITSVLQYLMLNNQYDEIVLLIESAGDEIVDIWSDLEDVFLQAVASQNNTDLVYCMRNIGLFYNFRQNNVEVLLEKVNSPNEKSNEALNLLLQCLETDTIGNSKQLVFTDSMCHGWYEEVNRIIDMYTTEGSWHNCIVIGDELQIKANEISEDSSSVVPSNMLEMPDETIKFNEIVRETTIMTENLEKINCKNVQLEKETTDISESNGILREEVNNIQMKIEGIEEKLERLKLLNAESELLLKNSDDAEMKYSPIQYDWPKQEVSSGAMIREKWKLTCQCGQKSCPACSSEIVAKYECTQSKQSGVQFRSLPEDRIAAVNMGGVTQTDGNKQAIETAKEEAERHKLVLLPQSEKKHVSVLCCEHKPFPKMYLYKFQASVSQSSIDGRHMPSNACALIALVFAYQYIKKPSIMRAIPPINNISEQVFDQVVTAIRYGNKTHELNFQGQPYDLSPEEVSLLTNDLGVKLLKQTDVDTRDPTTLIDHVMKLQSNQVILFIKHYKVVSIFPCNRNEFLLLFDSHPHLEPTSHYGAYLFFAKKEESTVRDLFFSYDELCDTKPFYGQFAIFEV